MNEILGILLLLIFIGICAHSDKSGKQGFKRRQRPPKPSTKYYRSKTLSLRKTSSSKQCEASGPAFEPSIHDSISYPGGYYAYIISPEWKAKRDLVVIRDGHQCQDCFSIEFLEVHHKHYLFLFREEVDNYRSLVTLCRDCHQTRHDNDPELFMCRGQ